MKKSVLISVSIFLLVSIGCSQNKQDTNPEAEEIEKASTIKFPDLSDEVVNNLELLGRVWGFLKYHHPAIAKGNYNWDYELLKFLPGYLALKTDLERDDALVRWINQYGKISPCKNCKPTSVDAVLKPDLSWINDTALSDVLKTKLNEIYNNRNKGKNYYISLQPGVANPIFDHEDAYSNIPYPGDGLRLLSLFRYWNMIEYFYPNKNITDKKWSTILKDYIPKFIAAKDELMYELVSLQLIGELHDSHANLWGCGDKISQLRGTNFAAFRGVFAENKLVVADYYNPELAGDSKLKIGDVITHINGKTVQSIVDSLRSYYPASNEAVMLRDISTGLLRSSQKAIHVRYISDNRNEQVEIPLYEGNKLNMYQWYKVNKDEKCYKFLDSNVGYITLANIKKEDIDDIKETFKNATGIIIDIRNYPSTFVPFAMGSYFVSKSTPFVKFSFGNIHNPGEFNFTKPLEIPADKNNYKGKLIVLVNENTQSQAEYTAMALRAGKNTIIVGSTTAGADGNVSTIMLPGGLRTMISGIGVYYPDGKPTQRIGIVPDVFIKPTIEGIKNGKDEVLEKAMEIVRH